MAGEIAFDQIIALSSKTTRRGSSLQVTGYILYVVKDVRSSKLSVKKLIFHGEGKHLETLVKAIQAKLKGTTLLCL